MYYLLCFLAGIVAGYFLAAYFARRAAEDVRALKRYVVALEGRLGFARAKDEAHAEIARIRAREAWLKGQAERLLEKL